MSKDNDRRFEVHRGGRSDDVGAVDSAKPDRIAAADDRFRRFGERNTKVLKVIAMQLMEGRDWPGRCATHFSYFALHGVSGRDVAVYMTSDPARIASLNAPNVEGHDPMPVIARPVEDWRPFPPIRRLLTSTITGLRLQSKVGRVVRTCWRLEPDPAREVLPQGGGMSQVEMDCRHLRYDPSDVDEFVDVADPATVGCLEHAVRHWPGPWDVLEVDDGFVIHRNRVPFVAAPTRGGALYVALTKIVGVRRDPVWKWRSIDEPS